MGFLRLQSGAIGDGRRFPKGWEGFGAALTACEFDVGGGLAPAADGLNFRNGAAYR